jgi:hypothetical protein
MAGRAVSTNVRHVHASGKSSRPRVTPAELAAALTYFATDPKVCADVITMTEASPYGGVIEKWAQMSGWYSYHPIGAGRSECAILSRAPFAATRSTRLTPLTLRSARKAPLYATSAQVDAGPWFSVTHTPAHNGGLDPTGKTAWPTRVYLSVAAGWHVARLRMKGHGVVLAADWNLDLARPKVRAQLARPYPHMTWGWHPGQAPTEGGRVIDGILTTLPHGPSTTLPAQPGFDHRPVLTVLEVR